MPGRTWVRPVGKAMAVAAVMGVVGSGLAGCGGSGGEVSGGVAPPEGPGTGSATAAATASPSPVPSFDVRTAAFDDCEESPDEELSLAAGSTCLRTVPLELDHPAHGQAFFATGLTRPLDSEAAGHLTYWLLDESMTVLEVEQTEGDYFSLVTRPVIDGSGNVLFEFNPGRSTGAVALRPTDQGWEDFESSPWLEQERGGVDYDTRFYAGRWIDVDGDGTFEAVDDEKTNADPDRPTYTYTWNGSDYELPPGVEPEG